MTQFEGRHFIIRESTLDDIPRLLELICQLAAHQDALDQVHATEDGLRRALGSDTPAAFAHVAEKDAVVVGYALWYLSFSPWAGRQCIWLADLYVEPTYRNSGIGKALVRTLAELCSNAGYERLEWKMQESNKLAADFYGAIGASQQAGRVLYQLKGQALQAFLASSPHACDT